MPSFIKDFLLTADNCHYQWWMWFYIILHLIALGLIITGLILAMMYSNLPWYIWIIFGLAIILSIASALQDTPVPANLVAFGEVGLSGEVRSVSQVARRVAEASRLGLNRLVGPAHGAHAERAESSRPLTRS